MDNKEYDDFENTVNDYIKKDKMYSQNEAYALQWMLTILIERIKSVMELKNCESMIDDELTIINSSIKLYYKYSLNSNYKTINFYDVNLYFEKMRRYQLIESLVILSKSNLIEMKIQKKRVVFENKLIDSKKGAMNFYNKLEYSQKVSSLPVDFSSSKTNSPIDCIYEESYSYINSIREFKNNIEIKEFYIEDYYRIYAYLYAYSYICKSNDQLFYMSKMKLVSKIKGYLNLPSEKILKILDILTYKNNQKSDVICTPLFLVKAIDGEISYLTSWPLFLFSNIERNSLVLFNKVYKKSFYSKESAMVSRFKSRLNRYENLKLRFNIELKKEKSNEKETDIDMAIYDKESQLLLFCELKNFNRPDSVNEHINFQGRKENEQLNKGFKQLAKIENIYKCRSEEVITKCINNKTERNCLKADYILVTNGYLGYYSPEETKIIEENNFLNLIDKNKGNLFFVLNDIINENSSPILDIDYYEIKNNIELAGYNIEFPINIIKHRDFI